MIRTCGRASCGRRRRQDGIRCIGCPCWSPSRGRARSPASDSTSCRPCRTPTRGKGTPTAYTSMSRSRHNSCQRIRCRIGLIKIGAQACQHNLHLEYAVRSSCCRMHDWIGRHEDGTQAADRLPTRSEPAKVRHSTCLDEIDPVPVTVFAHSVARDSDVVPPLAPLQGAIPRQTVIALFQTRVPGFEPWGCSWKTDRARKEREAGLLVGTHTFLAWLRA